MNGKYWNSISHKIGLPPELTAVILGAIVVVVVVAVVDDFCVDCRQFSGSGSFMRSFSFAADKH